MISFDVKNVEMPQLDYDKVCVWLNEVAAGFDKKIGNLNYLFCDDPEIIRVNRQFLQHDYFTDIITFDYSNQRRVGGDIFISLDTVRSNSEKFGVSYDSELLRVIAHGLFHLCGINDKGEGEREVMEQYENQSLRLWETIKDNRK